MHLLVYFSSQKNRKTTACKYKYKKTPLLYINIISLLLFIEGLVKVSLLFFLILPRHSSLPANTL